MSEKIRVTWHVGDGYVGKGRPQTSSFDLFEFDGMTDEEIKQYIEEGIAEDFENTISYGASDAEILAAVERVRIVLGERND